MKGGGTAMPLSVDTASNEEDICSLFADNYNELYNSVPYDQNALDDLLHELNFCIATHESTDCHNVSVADVREAVHKLKAQKHDGYKGMYSDHIINGPECLFLYLSLLFNAMLVHGSVPLDFTLSTLTPIPKNCKKSLNDSSNYRAIALSSVLAKLLDNIILQKSRNVFKSCDYQFGFKKKHSTNLCTFVVNEVTQHFVSNQSNMYLTLLDAS